VIASFKNTRSKLLLKIKFRIESEPKRSKVEKAMGILKHPKKSTKKTTPQNGIYINTPQMVRLRMGSSSNVVRSMGIPHKWEILWVYIYIHIYICSILMYIILYMYVCIFNMGSNTIYSNYIMCIYIYGFQHYLCAPIPTFSHSPRSRGYPTFPT